MWQWEFTPEREHDDSPEDLGLFYLQTHACSHSRATQQKDRKTWHKPWEGAKIHTIRKVTSLVRPCLGCSFVSEMRKFLMATRYLSCPGLVAYQLRPVETFPQSHHRQGLPWESWECTALWTGIGLMQTSRTASVRLFHSLPVVVVLDIIFMIVLQQFLCTENCTHMYDM